jgi:hypothetical protein
MTSQSRGRRELQALDQYPLLGIINDAFALAHRYAEGERFRAHVAQRLRLVVPMGCLILFVSVACASAVMLALGELHRSLVLVGIVVMPLVLVASLFAQGYVFFSWLELRALGQRGAAGRPPVPWALVAASILAPLALLAVVAWKSALVLLAVAALAPLVYDALDR